jgi:hypothetical protein
MLGCGVARAVNKILTESPEELIEIRSRQLYNDGPFIVLALIARHFDDARRRQDRWRVPSDEQ